MNIGEQSLDLCNVKTKSNVDDDHNSTNNTEGIIPRITELMMDGDVGKQGTEATDTYSLPRLTNNPLGDKEDNHRSQETLEIDEVNGNKNNCVQNSPAVVNPTDLNASVDKQNTRDIRMGSIKEDKDTGPANLVLGEGDDGGDMDIGVDLSLDESGVLEAEPTNLGPSPSGESSASVGTEPEPTTQDVVAEEEAAFSPPGSSSEPGQESTAAAGSVQGQAPTLEEGDDKHKAGGKRVTFPSDEDIVSGAVEPKDPWRHGNNIQVCGVSVCSSVRAWQGANV